MKRHLRWFLAWSACLSAVAAAQPLPIVGAATVEGRLIYYDSMALVQAKSREDVARQMERIARAGFNMVMVPTNSDGYVFYGSEILDGTLTCLPGSTCWPRRWQRPQAQARGSRMGSLVP